MGGVCWRGVLDTSTQLSQVCSEGVWSRGGGSQSPPLNDGPLSVSLHDNSLVCTTSCLTFPAVGIKHPDKRDLRQKGCVLDQSSRGFQSLWWRRRHGSWISRPASHTVSPLEQSYKFSRSNPSDWLPPARSVLLKVQHHHPVTKCSNVWACEGQPTKQTNHNIEQRSSPGVGPVTNPMRGGQAWLTWELPG